MHNTYAVSVVHGHYQNVQALSINSALDGAL